MRTILFLTNFSKASRKALFGFLKFSTENISESINLILLNTYTRPQTGQGLMLSITDIIEENAIADLKQEKKLIEKEFGKDKINIQIEARQGKPYLVIERLCESINIDLLLIGISSSNVLKELIMGNVPGQIIANTTIPTLLIPENLDFVKPQKIAVAANLNSIGESLAFKRMVDVLSIFKSDLVFLHLKSELDKNDSYLEILSKFVKSEFSHYSIDVNNIYQGITDYLNENDSNLIAILDEKEDAVYKLYNQNVTKKLTSLAKYPFIVVHDDREATE